MIPALGAVGAAAARSLVADAGAAAASVPAGGQSFEQALASSIANAVGSLQGGEAAAIEGVTGKTTPMNVVDSIMSAQRSLQTVLAIRDKAVGAYQEVARMAI